MGIGSLITSKNKPTKVVAIGAILYYLIQSIQSGWFDYLTLLVYAGTGAAIIFIVDKLDGNKKWGFINIALVGMAASLAFNVGGQALGWFAIEMTSTLFAALQQGLLTGILWEIMGGRK